MVHMKRWNRCLSMLVTAALFLVAALAFIIPGSIGVAPGGNHYNDILLYLGLLWAIFGIIFLAGWWLCQLEVEENEDEAYHNQLLLRKKKQFYASSSCHVKPSADIDSAIELLPHGEA